MKDLTIIIPIVELNAEKFQFYTKAIESAKGENIIVVGSPEAIKSAQQNICPVTYIENKGDTCYAAQVNLAVKSVKTKYFSVLEFDDVYSKIWLKNVEEYISVDTEDTFGYFPLTEIVDNQTKQVIGYANEAFWASSFSEEIGVLDINSIQDYLNFNTSGAVFKTEEFIALGGLKESMKLVFWYEFLLRVIYKEKRIYVIPKVGYFHTVNREGNMTTEYASTMSPKEADWWIDLAKKEYFFPQDRKKTYEE